MQQKGIPRYSPEQIRKEIAMNYNSVDQKKWYTHYNQSETAMNWLIDIMAEAGYECALEEGPVIVPDDIYYTAPSAHGFINSENKSVGMTQPFVVNTLAAKLQALGGKIYYKNIGRQLVRGGAANGTSGRVTAVIAEREDGRFVKYEGTKAVVLATGDFSADREMMAKYSPWCAKYISDEVYDGPMDYDKEFVFGGLYRGEGHKMGLWVGAAWQKTFPNAPMGGTISAGPSPIVYDPFFGLLVDRNGERFMNEYASSQLSGRTQWLQAGEKSYAIWDRDFVKTSDKWFPAQGGIGIMQPITPAEVVARWDGMAENGSYKRANTLEALVDALGLPREKTLQTISRYNELCDKKTDTDFYKRPDKLIAIKTAPFYGAVSGGVGLLCVLGGLRTNARMQVCDESDNPIPGLYNIGTMVGDFYAGLYTFQMEGINYGAACITFGYLAGKYIAAGE
jgi:succinate dehydrogenase/fumarate reductase flavoprotein subunit